MLNLTTPELKTSDFHQVSISYFWGLQDSLSIIHVLFVTIHVLFDTSSIIHVYYLLLFDAEVHHVDNDLLSHETLLVEQVLFLNQLGDVDSAFPCLC